MKKTILGTSCALCLVVFTTMSFAQSEGGNSSSSAGSGARGTNGEKNVAGETQARSSITNAPSGDEFHPPTTSPDSDQHVNP